MGLSLTRNFNQSVDFDGLKSQIIAFVAELEDYLNDQTGVYVIQSQGPSGKIPLPTLKKGDIVFDLNRVTGIVTLQQWDGKKFISLGFQTITGPLPQEHGVDLIGDQDGVNPTFTTPSQYALGTTHLYFNGQRLKRGALFDYDESPDGLTITFISIIPAADDTVIIDYNTQ